MVFVRKMVFQFPKSSLLYLPLTLCDLRCLTHQAAVGGTAVAGVATAAAGAVFAPAIPFIVAGSLAGGGLWGASSSKEEQIAREHVMTQCLRGKGYEVYSARGYLRLIIPLFSGIPPATP